MPTAVEQIIFTAIPNGIASTPNGNRLSVSICVSPTLMPFIGATGTLSDYPDFQNWPSTFSQQDLDFAVTITNQTKSSSQTLFASPTTIAPYPSLTPSLWTALFAPPSGVQYTEREAYEKTLTTTPVVSYPAAGPSGVASWLQNTYTALTVASPNAYPSLSDLATYYGSIGYANQQQIAELNDEWAALSDERLGTFATHEASPTWANDWTGANPSEAFAALRFYHMFSMPGVSQVPPPVALPTVDFHRALTFINQHAALQRALGLVFDLELVPDAVNLLGSALTSNFYISAVPMGVTGAAFSPSSGVSYQPVSPRTQCDASTSVFQAHAASTQIVSRQLTLGDTSSFTVYEVDADGGGLHTTQFADNIQLAQSPQSNDPSSPNGPAPDAPTSYAPPSLRSIGLTVAAVNRGINFVNALQRATTVFMGINHTPPTPPDLTAEDLVKGYVLDVYDETGWNSTAMRDVTYAANGVTTIAITDEPGTDAPPRMQNDPTHSSQPQLNLPENIIRWNGWSNAAPRIGNAIQEDGTTNPPSGSQDGPFSQLTITAAAHPGSLPRLRFGSTYQLRARVVDLASNVIPLAAGAPATDATICSPASVFARHEPVGSPDVYNWDTPLPGESLKRLVIRDLEAAAGSASSLRALAPNMIAELFAELHGKFDTGSSGAINGSSNTYDLITANTGPTARYPSPTTAIALTSPVPYFPDPLSRGGTLNEIQGALSGNTYQFDFDTGQPWPGYEPFGLLLTPGATQTVSTDNTKRQITFDLTPADTVILQLSSHIDSSDLNTLGMYQWVALSFGGFGHVPSSLESNVVNGLVWSVTPWTTVDLVYAVQKPLLLPSFPFISAEKEIGWTYAVISGDITYSPKSTSKTDMLANWGDPVDNGPGTGTPMGPGVPAPHEKLVDRMATPFTIPSTLTQQSSATDRFSAKHEFFDTKHRVVTYTGQSTSAFTEHYQGSATIASVPAPGTATALALPGYTATLGVEPGSVTVTGSDGTVYPDSSFTIDPTAGTITFIANAGGPATGSSVTVSFLPTVSVETAKPPTLNILSSARPLSPDIEFIVPIYEWLKVHSTPKTILSGRSASALRIFMPRPWWSSGVGELLGVVTWPLAEYKDIVSTMPAADELYCSDWGADPVFDGHALPTAHPRLESFPKRVHTGKNLTIDENPHVRVNVAGHAVEYDPVRDLWYSDVIVDFGLAYTPMIRLALARYQPDSVSGVELSRIVLADVMSLEPERVVLIRRSSPTMLARVELAGPSYHKDGDQIETGPGLAELVVERRVPEIADQVIGWEPVSKPVVMDAHIGPDGLTTWSARNIKVPSGGKHRLFLVQYEVIPTDPRGAPKIYDTYVPSRGLRVLYQDLIPL